MLSLLIIFQNRLSFVIQVVFGRILLESVIQGVLQLLVSLSRNSRPNIFEAHGVEIQCPKCFSP